MLTCQKHQPEPFGHFKFGLTFWKLTISPSKENSRTNETPTHRKQFWVG